MTKKAQIWSMDFAASLVIFITTLILMLFAWNYTIQQNQQQLTFNYMENAAMEVSDSLIRHPGIPENWNSSTVTTIGLASQENVLNETKISYFLEMNNNTIKNLLGIENYDFYFDVRYTNDTLAEIPGGGQIVKGSYPENASIAIPSERYVIYMDKIAKMRFVLWI